MAAADKTSLVVMDHPLVDHKFSVLRDRNTPSHHFRQTLHELSWLLAHPTFAALRTVDRNIETPLEPMTAKAMPQPYPCLVSILRAGNGLIGAQPGLSRGQRRPSRPVSHYDGACSITAACPLTLPTVR